MVANRLQLVFFIIATLLVLGLNVLIFLPYVSILFLAFVFAVVFTPMFDWLNKKFGDRRALASLVSVFLVFVFIAGPVLFFGAILFQESSDLYTKLLDEGEGALGLSTTLSPVGDFITTLFPGVQIESLEVDLATYMQRGLSWLVDHVSVLFTGVFKIFVGLFLMLLALFYFFRDGKKFMNAIVSLSPLDDFYDKKIIERTTTAVNSVVRGHIVIGVIQGFLVGLGFFIFGVPSPVLWGTVAALASFIPTIGTTIVILPAIIFLYVSGSIGASIGLLIWGATAVGMIDNLLGPLLIERGIKIHPLLILLSALGGISLFGPIGFLAGPVCLSILFAFLDIYPKVVSAKN